MSASPIILPSDPMKDRDVMRGRNYCAGIREIVADAIARGRAPSAVHVHPEVCSYMRIFFAARAEKFDGVLPSHVLGVRLVEATGDDDVRLVYEPS